MQLSVVRQGRFTDLRLQVGTTRHSVGFKDFDVHIYDDLKHEVPCVPLGEVGSFLGFGGIFGTMEASGFYRLVVQAGRSPATAEVFYQGRKYTFAFQSETQAK